MKRIDLGLIHSSAAEALTALIVNRLRRTDEIADGVSPNTLIRNWSPAFTEWSTKAIRDAFFASPLLPRLLNAEVVQETIARGVANGLLAYVGKAGAGTYKPFHFQTTLIAADVEISDDMFVITREAAEAYLAKPRSPNPAQPGGTDTPYPPGGPRPPPPASTMGRGDGHCDARSRHYAGRRPQPVCRGQGTCRRRSG